MTFVEDSIAIQSFAQLIRVKCIIILITDQLNVRLHIYSGFVQSHTHFTFKMKERKEKKKPKPKQEFTIITIFDFRVRLVITGLTFLFFFFYFFFSFFYSLFNLLLQNIIVYPIRHLYWPLPEASLNVVQFNRQYTQ